MDEVRLLEEAARNLFFPSESDHPFEAFSWKVDSEALGEEQLLRLSGHPAESPVEAIDLEHLFRNVVREHDWHDDDEKRAVNDFQRLLHTLKTILLDIKVFRVGKIQIEVYVVGRTQSGDWAGIKTKIVET